MQPKDDGPDAVALRCGDAAKLRNTEWLTVIVFPICQQSQPFQLNFSYFSRWWIHNSKPACSVSNPQVLRDTDEFERQK